MLNFSDPSTLDKMIMMNEKALQREQLCERLKEEIEEILCLGIMDRKASEELHDKILFLTGYRDNMFENLLADYKLTSQIDTMWDDWKVEREL